jgi:hypothetical protein
MYLYKSVDSGTGLVLSRLCFVLAYTYIVALCSCSSALNAAFAAYRFTVWIRRRAILPPGTAAKGRKSV